MKALLAIALTTALLAAPPAADGLCRTKACFKRLHSYRGRQWCKRHPGCLWRLRFKALPGWERVWARCVAHFETFGTPWRLKASVATGNGYYGAVQFLPATWHAAGGSGLPSEHSLHEQLVRAIWWARAAGASQWSTSGRCGR